MFPSINSSAGPRLPGEYGIKEVIPNRFWGRYEKWRSEFLATEFGRSQWDRYASDKNFLLTIIVSGDHKFGAGTGGYDWNSKGELIAATLTLGKDLDKGFPEPIYYPVMNSLSTDQHLSAHSGNLLASTKIAHELGHVSYTAEIDERTFNRQNELMESYYKIFLKNGYKTDDARLVKLETELGAKPIEIWEDREYWSEVAALRFVVERLENTSRLCPVMGRIQDNLTNFADAYRPRFAVIGGVGSYGTCR